MPDIDPPLRALMDTLNAAQSAGDALVAKVGGGQALGTLLRAMLNRFTGVASAGDSALLPSAVVGIAHLTVINDHAANAMNVFPQPGERINSAAIDAAFSVPATKTATFSCSSRGRWHTVLSA